MNLNKQRTFLRIDGNVPLQNENILNDYKLQAILPTIDHLQKEGAHLIIGTHLGRPTAQTKQYLSTKQLVPWFEKNGIAIQYVEDLDQVAHHDFSYSPTPILLENLRFHKGESSGNQKFAKQLHSLSDIYINDAFGAIHRDDTSIALLPTLYAPNERSTGLLIKKEIAQLNKIKQNPAQNFVLVIGGNKLATKTVLLKSMITKEKSSRPQTILIGGALAHPFLQAQSISVGSSLKHPESVAIAQELLTLAKEYGVKIILPIDALVSNDLESNITKSVAINNIENDDIIIDIGSKTIQIFSKVIADAQTIFANGTMGLYSIPAFAHGTNAIMKALAQSSAHTVIGGGDATAAAFACGMANQIDVLSTGGGATLAYLAIENTHELPGLAYLD